MNNNYNNQNMNYDPNTGQPLNSNYNNQNNQNYNQYNYQNQQYYNQGQYPGMPMNNQLDQADKNKLTIAAVLLVIGIFIAGIICGASAIILACQVNKKSTGKTAIIIIGAIEIAIVLLAVMSGSV